LFDRLGVEKEQLVPRRSTLPFPHGRDQRVPNSRQQGDITNKESWSTHLSRPITSDPATVFESMSTQAPIMSNLSLLAAAAEDQRRHGSCPPTIVRVGHFAQPNLSLPTTPITAQNQDRQQI
jgi:hypothetical protein